MAGGGGSAGMAGAGGSSACNATPDEDKDGDGFSINQGDCDDCNAQINPGAIEVTGVTPAVDDDCDGKVDNAPAPCDDNIALDTSDPVEAAKAIEICKSATSAKDWGLVGAKWVLPDGTAPSTSTPDYDLGHGVLPSFGSNVHPQSGKKLLDLSSGTARQPTDPGYQSPSGFDKGYASAQPAGFPKTSPACNTVTPADPHDGVALEVTLRAPTNAVGFSYDFKFYTYDWPDWTCGAFNDFFLGLLSPAPSGQSDGNLSFDFQGNLISANVSFLNVCDSCSGGISELAGTGYDAASGTKNHGATSWLRTTAPVQAGSQISLRFTVYDSGDGALDSSALVDNFAWITQGTPSVGTTPIANPK